MKKINTTLALSIILLTVVAIASIGISTAGIVTNIDTGEEFTEIQKAIDDDDTVNGHTLVIGNGSYLENVNISKTLSLRSVATGKAYIRAEISSSPVFKTIENNVTISGLTIVGTSYTTATGVVIASIGINIWQGCDCCVNNCTFMKTDEGLRLMTTDRNIVRDNCFKSTSEDSIFLKKSTNSIIEHNEISKSAGDGIWMHQCQNILLKKNSISDSEGHGLHVYNSSNVKIQDSLITKGGINGIKAISVTNLIIDENEISHNNRDGIQTRGSYCVITNNTITNNGEWAVFHAGLGTVLLKDNICSGNGIDNCDDT